MGKYIIALDQGTTSSRSIVFNASGSIIGVSQQEFTQIYPHPGWVEHNAEEIWSSQLSTLKEVIQKTGIKPEEIDSIGITNQRETTVLWNKYSGKPVYNAIVWQDKRTASICDELKNIGLQEYVKQNTGLVIDSYFSATKISWILENVPGVRALAEQGDILFGTVDSWLLWNLTGGKVHATDYSNASRTMLYKITNLHWDEKMLAELAIPSSILPEVKPSSGLFGHTTSALLGISIPICGIAGDQQAALFGQTCFEPGTAKNTYGTGCFMLMNTGTSITYSKNGLLTTIAWGLDGKVEYALEGSVFVAGAAIQWLRDGLKLLDAAPDSEYFASKVSDSEGVYVVPAFAGLGAPYWDMYARGAIFGLTRGTTKGHIARATLESLAYQTKDVLTAMESDADITLKALKVDGGASANNLLMQFQADILGTEVHRPTVLETTALGAAYLAGIATGFYSKSNLAIQASVDRTFKPNMKEDEREKRYKGWQKAVKRCMDWEEH